MASHGRCGDGCLAKGEAGNRRISGAVGPFRPVAAHAGFHDLPMGWAGGRMDGVEVAQVFRSANPDLRVVMVTGFASADLEARMKKEPSTRLLVKPVMAGELVKAVQDTALQRQ